jgi:glycerophosphoryl diester phosphodiesterase
MFTIAVAQLPIVDNSSLSGRRPNGFPQAIAHRGFRATQPENTMLAFSAAVAAGAHALETDMHLTKDGVVVLSHDPTMKRCFGKDVKIIDETWEDLKELKTLKEPHVSMPRLSDLLDWLAVDDEGREDVWVLLDIKIDNNHDDVMRLIGETLASVEPGKRSWEERIVLGIWTVSRASCLPCLPRFFVGIY